MHRLILLASAAALLISPVWAQTPTLDSVTFAGSTSGSVALKATAIAGTNTATLPAATGTVGLVLSGTTTSIGGGALAAGHRPAAPQR